MQHWDDKISQIAREERIVTPPGFEERMEMLTKQLKDDKKNNIVLLKEKKKTRRVAAIIAVIIVVGASTTAIASGVNFNDIFKGFFKEKPTGENTVVTQVQEDNDQLNKAGSVLYQQAVDGGLVLTVRGIVGDDNSIYLAFDVATQDGSEFTGTQNDKVNSYKFDKIFMKVEGSEIGQYCSANRIDDGSESGKATFMINENINCGSDGLIGKNITLTIENMLVENTEIQTLGMDKDIYGLLNEFTKEEQGMYSFEGISASGDENMESTDDEKIAELMEKVSSGEVTEESLDAAIQNAGFSKGVEITKHYTLMKSGRKIPFSSKYPDISLNNMAFIGNSLYFNIEYGGDFTASLLDNKELNIYNTKNNSNLDVGGGGRASMSSDSIEIEGDESQADIIDNQYMSCRCNIDGIKSIDDLKNTEFALGGSYSFDVAYKGAWKFNFPIEYVDTTVVYDNFNSELSDGSTITSIELSPISIKLAVDSEDYSLNSLRICMNDGEEYKIKEITTHSEDNTEIRAFLPLLVNVDDVEAVIINGEKVNMK